ncbi:MAG: hypothetical protein VCE43_15975 [Myxococcota bacterium]
MNTILKPVLHARTSLLTLVLLVLAAVALYRIEFDRNQPAQGAAISGVRKSFVAGHPVRDNRRPLLEVFRDLPAGESGSGPIVWIGNSHLHAVNAIKPGDRLSSTLLHVALNDEVFPGERPVFGISMPNLRFEEQFLLTAAMAQLPEARRPSAIVHGARFHDARRTGVRERVRPLLRTPRMRDWLASTDWAANFPEAESAMQRSLVAADEEIRADEGLEAWMVSQVGPYLPIFQRRLFIEFKVHKTLGKIRNWVFRIDTASKRGILPTRYRAGMQFLEAALRVANQAGIRVLLYNAPLRKGVNIPYIDSEYARFREDLAAMAQRQGVDYQDYDELIPTEAWGNWVGSDMPDFSHFTGEGHVILAERARQDLQHMFEGGDETVEDEIEGAKRVAL